jgi:hypothetical protein
MPVSPPASKQPNILDRFALLVSQYPLGVAVAATLALTLLSITVFTPRYETNDDVTMQLIASGLVFSDRPDEHLLFSNVLIGRALKALYVDVPSVPWYALYQVGTLMVAAAALAYALLRVDPTPRQVFVLIVIFVVAVLPCFIEIQFTKTAFLATFAGLLLLLAPLRGATPWPRAADLVGCGLVVWGSLIRYESCLLAGLVAMPVAAVAAFADWRRAAWRALPLALTVVVAMGLQQYNRSYYAGDENWRGFYPYNAVRAEFTDYLRYAYNPVTERAFRDAGWSPIDYYMMLNWCYADKDRYSLSRLQQIAATVPASSGASLQKSSWDIVINLPRFPELIRIMVAVAVAGTLTGSGPWRFVLPAALFVLALSLTVVLATYFWLPVRVAVPLFAGVAAASAFRPRAPVPANRSAPSAFDAVLCGGAALLGGVLIVLTFIDHGRKDGQQNRFHADMNRVMRVLKPRPDQLFVLWREWFPLEKLVFPFQDVSGLRNFRCVSLSTLLPTPFTDERLHQYDISDIYQAIYERPDVYVLAMKELIKLYQAYVNEHYGVKVAYADLFSAEANRSLFVGVPDPPRFVVYKLIDSTKIPPEPGRVPDPQKARPDSGR